MCMISQGMALYLATAIGGYWVLERAESHKEGSLRRIGRVLGIIIIVLSFLSIALVGGYPQKRRHCGMKAPGMHRSQTVPPAAPGMLGE